MRLDSPIRLRSARAWRTYTGGRLIDEMHGVSPARDTHFPEDWIASVVRANNPGREDVVEGLGELASGGYLRDLVAADPASALGAAHVTRFGASPAVLVKIIDAAERLAVQVHPDKERARRFFGSPFGKTECWHIIDVRSPDACVHLGFKPGVTKAAWRRAFFECSQISNVHKSQMNTKPNGNCDLRFVSNEDLPFVNNSDFLLSLMHRLPARPGDTFLVKAGVPHAIGAGCLLVEIQEPTDYTLRVERVTPQGYRMSDLQMHGGIGFDAMFECFDYEGVSEAEALRRWRIAPRILEGTSGFTRTELVGAAQTPCFTLERIDICGECRLDSAGRFCALYATAGSGEIRSSAGAEPIRPGDQFFVPASAAPFEMAASSSHAPLVVFRALPPDSVR